MKKILLILMGIILWGITVNAQYRINKLKYDPTTYEHQAGDRYCVPFVSLTSLILPGTGHFICGEFGRGIPFMLGAFVSDGIIATGLLLKFTDVLNAAFGVENKNPDIGMTLITVGAVSYLIITTWAILDVIKVAKVNNLAYRDRHKTTSINLTPYLEPVNLATSTSMATGIKLTITFH
ncbi:MAG: hypothetical protein Q8862_07120 [Bacteroidota bacterium]|nr:hypothetical protein [Bacteroidota bacterium]